MQIKSVDEHIDYLKSLCIVSGDVPWWNCCGKSLAVPWYLKHRIPTWPGNFQKNLKHVKQTVVKERW